eukprot:gb/GEZN01010227.1/.p1 GENE.gb/GEZN01010227.1/~~gb/GEZN01010227.1/.p1  ORF type:complete len:295 (+),score=15.95 gb/GEZN01010227.1/:32-916(+)
MSGILHPHETASDTFQAVHDQATIEKLTQGNHRKGSSGGNSPSLANAKLEIKHEQEYEAAFWEYSGMSEIVDDLKQAVNYDLKPGAGVNGWALLGLTVGMDALTERLRNRLDTFAIISGLLLSTNLSILSSIPDSLVASWEDDDDLVYGYMYSSILTVSVICHFAVIMLGTLLNSILNASARNSDRWRVILTNGKVVSVIDAAFTLGNLFMTVAMAFTQEPIFGWQYAVFFGSVISLVCAVAMHFFNRTYFVNIGHPVHGWYKRHLSEYHLEIPFKQIELLANLDRRNKRKYQD